MKRLTPTILLALALAAPVTRADNPNFHVTQIGSPTWVPTDFHMFTAPIGTPADGFAEFFSNVVAILGPTNHVFFDGVLLPGTPHSPPYTNEMANGIVAAGFREGTAFSAKEFSFPNGVWVSWMYVPNTNAPTGATPDYASGSVISNSLCPIIQTGLTRRNGVGFDSAWDSVEAEALLPAMFPDVDGYSHFPVANAEAYELGPPRTPAGGLYLETFTHTDTAGNGWTVTADYQVYDHSLAITKITAPHAVRLTRTRTSQRKLVAVTIQNRGRQSEIISNLTGLVTLDVHSLTNACPDLDADLLAPRPQRTLPVTLKSKASFKVFFQVTYSTDCVPDALKTTRRAAHNDYRYTASLDTAAGIDGLPDVVTADDLCPRLPQEADPFSVIADQGCGGRIPHATLGADVTTDVFVQ